MEYDNTDVLNRLFARLRQDANAYSVPGSLPVLFFGDPFKASAATVGLNPSHREYLDKQADELQGPNRRFQTLHSLAARSRCDLTDKQCQIAIETMRQYFAPDKPVYDWFRPLDRLTNAMGLRYDYGQVTHLDLVQEATNPTWSNLRRIDPREFHRLRAMDLPFLKWELETFPISTIICNGRTPFNSLVQMFGATTVREGSLARIRWYATHTTISRRSVCIVGWNIPLMRPTGLGIEGEHQLGRSVGDACQIMRGNRS